MGSIHVTKFPLSECLMFTPHLMLGDVLLAVKDSPLAPRALDVRRREHERLERLLVVLLRHLVPRRDVL